MSYRPNKIVCVGRSYADHAKELGNAVPDRPVLFIKPASSLIGLDDGISWDESLGSCHHECELTLRIDQTLKAETDPVKALEAIGAVTLGLDLTLRDLQTELKTKGSLGSAPNHLMVLVCLPIGSMSVKLKTGKMFITLWK
jgi:2-keto-4-pentenoate hydratase/2-oxohepta-3-ene-1,7-dioic acid hydratase in catechol pathway